MALSKNAFTRYRILDRCLSDFSRKYFLEDLLFAVNDQLHDMGQPNISQRTLYEDLRYMASDSGFSADIDKLFTGKKPYYRYASKGFTIFKSPLSRNEMLQLGNSLKLLATFEGEAGFGWIAETRSLLQDRFGFALPKPVMALENNLDYTGMQWLGPVFQAIIHRRVLRVCYKPFFEEQHTFSFHPYYMKQYNNRWFAFGLHQEKQEPTWNLALDRIVVAHETSNTYQHQNIDWDSFFYDIVGVTNFPEVEVQQIQLLFSKDVLPYIETKPLHPSQRMTRNPDGSALVTLKVKPNYELEQLVLSFGEKVQVLGPKEFVMRCAKRIDAMQKRYKNSTHA